MEMVLLAMLLLMSIFLVANFPRSIKIRNHANVIEDKVHFYQDFWHGYLRLSDLNGEVQGLE